jgi:hypothetical protein
MVLSARPLSTPYAMAVGDAVLARVKAFGKLPADTKDDYESWREAHQRLGAAAAPAGPDARALDPFVDRAVLAPAKACQAIVEAYEGVPVELDDAQRRRLDDARAVLAIYGDDLRAIVTVPYVEEWNAVRDVLVRFASEPGLAAALKRLGLEPDVALARALHARYGAALGIGAADVGGDDEAARLAAWNEAFARLLVAATYLGRKTPGLLELFAEPYEAHLAKQREVSARARRARGAAAAPDAPAGADGEA